MPDANLREQLRVSNLKGDTLQGGNVCLNQGQQEVLQGQQQNNKVSQSAVEKMRWLYD